MLLGCILLSTLLHLLALPFVEDDAYIHIRNARNLWNQGLPYFNLSTPCLSSSSILWLLLISPLSAFHHYQEHAIAFLNAVITVLAARLTGELSLRLWSSLGSVRGVATSVLTYAALLPSSLALMESSCAVLAGTLALLLIFNKNRLWSIVACSLPLIRPELAIALPLLCCTRWRSRTWPWRGVEILLPLLLWAIVGVWYLQYFGLHLPQSILAKSVVYQISLPEFCRFLVLAIIGNGFSITVISAWLLALLLIVLFLIWRGGSQKPIQRTTVITAAALVAFPALVVSAYAVRGVLVFPWYAPPMVTPLLLALAPIWDGKNRWWRIGGYICVLPILISGTLSALVWSRPDMATYGPSGSRASTLRRIGEAIVQINPNGVVLAPEIGGLGRGFSGTVFDGVGLASPAALAFHPLRVPEDRSAGFLGALPEGLVATVSPDFIVGLPTLLEAVIRSPLSSKYERITVPLTYRDIFGMQRPIQVWGNSSIIIFARPEFAQKMRDAL